MASSMSRPISLDAVSLFAARFRSLYQLIVDVLAAGLTNMLNTGASIQGFECAAPGDASTVSCSMSVCGCGSLLLYATSAPCNCLVNGAPVQAAYAAEQQALRVPVSRSGDSVVSRVEVEFQI